MKLEHSSEQKGLKQLSFKVTGNVLGEKRVFDEAQRRFPTHKHVLFSSFWASGVDKFLVPSVVTPSKKTHFATSVSSETPKNRGGKQYIVPKNRYSSGEERDSLCRENSGSSSFFGGGRIGGSVSKIVLISQIRRKKYFYPEKEEGLILRASLFEGTSFTVPF